MRAITLLAVNTTLAVVTASIAGPRSAKLEGQFGLVGWAARVPFYLLQLYIGPLILTMKQEHVSSVGLFGAVMLVLPLALWSVGTKCPPLVAITYLCSGTLQGYLLGRLAVRLGS